MAENNDEEEDEKSFVQDLAPKVQEVFSGISESIVIAHAAYESGWGGSFPYRKGKNLFNITRLPKDPRPIIVSGDLEYSKTGQVKKITQRFAKYDSVEECLADYKLFIGKARYGLARQFLGLGDLGGFLSELYKGGYFTLPLAKYLADMSKVLDKVTLILHDN